MKKDIEPLPHFNNEDEEREFWATHSVTDYFDTSNAYRPTEPFLKLKASEGLLAFQIPKQESDRLNSLAKKHHLTPDALAQRFISEGIRREMGQARP